MVGISGAFLLLPFQMSVLQYTAPSVSATNLVFNLVAIPGGVYRYVREGRMLWSLVLIIALGTLPGILIGYFVRVYYLPDPAAFKLFVGCVLLYIAYRLFAPFLPWARTTAGVHANNTPSPSAAPNGSATIVRTVQVSPARVVFTYRDETCAFGVPAMLLLAFVVGTIGGIYGIGGGSIIAPFLIAFFRLPVYTVSGAALAATLLTSVFGVLFYTLLPAPIGLSTQPDWALGLLFGLGGIAGMYLGARMQKFVPQFVLKLLLGSFMLALALHYISAFVTD